MHAHILLIDDEPESMESVLGALHAQDWRVDVAVNGKQGVEYARTLAPDLILLDMFMPGMDGMATCRQLKELPSTRDTPILFLTSAGGDDDRLAGLSGGGVDYMVKPCLPAEVVARVRIHLCLAKRVATLPDGSDALLSSDELLLRAAMRLIGAHLAQLPTLEQIAREVGTHDKRLSVIFRKHLGMTVFAWVREERLRMSRQLLADPDMSIHDIAARVGFHSAANFATAFRARMGCTPSQYRTNMRQARQSTPDDA